MSNRMLQALYEDMLHGPAPIYVVTVKHFDGTWSFYSFDDEVSQIDYVEMLSANTKEYNIDLITFGETLLNYTDHDEEMFVIH